MLDDEVIVEAAPAKLNLALHVRGRRADGYHELETLFAFARDGDVVTVAPATMDSFASTGPFAADLPPHPSAAAPLPPSPSGRGASGRPASQAGLNSAGRCSPDAGPAREASGKGEGDWAANLVTRAARAFVAAFAPGAAHAVALEKNLPVASGIGGGSADAAATLRALARLHGVEPGEPRLAAIARSLGADVPACLLGRTALGTGRGDDLTPLEPLGDLPALLVNPLVAVPTGPVFAGWDGVDRGGIAGEGGVMERARAGRNDLAAPAVALAPAIADVLAWLGAAPGATFARMSGSGATCLALFATLAERTAAAAALAVDRPGWWRLETVLI